VLEEGDLSLLPILSTGFIDPFHAEPTISFFSKIVEADSKKPFSRDPRAIAQKAENYLRKKGIADDCIWGPEFEYYVFDDVAVSNTGLQCGFEMIPTEGRYEGNFGLGIHEGYHALPPEDTLMDLRDRTVTLLEEVGVSTIYHHHEVGGHGQVEIETDFTPLTRTADVGMLVKYFARMTAHQFGKIATFMPKPLHGEPGSGMHCHQFLVKKGKSLFYSRSGYAGLSKLGLHYIAGLLKHAPALLALTNPSTNSYKRLVPGFEAPINCFFSLANRSAAIRIPKYATSQELKRIEFRIPDATCNIYLALAAQVMAGVDGIKKKLDPTELGFGPFDVNIFEMPPKKRKKIKSLPTSLPEALDALAKDHDFLLEGNVFTKSMIEEWIRLKFEKEVVPVRNRTHPIEVQLYLDC
jgi:glutamine synthetase